MDKDIEYLNLYIDNMEKTKFKTLRLLGLKNIKEFLEDEKNEAFIKKETIESVYNNLNAKVEELWNLTYSLELLRKAINEKEDIWTWIQYTKANNIVEVIPDFEKVYLESDELNESLESLLINLGSNHIKERIYAEFKALYYEEERRKQNYSYKNIIGKQYKEERKIISKIAVLGEVNDNEALIFIEKLLEDYNPQVRVKAIEVLGIVEENKIKEKPQLVEKIIKRIEDKPEYISKAAMAICKNKNIEVQAY
jgi:HEAT repeat protein